MGRLAALVLGVALPAFAEGELFHGWSKDGTWLVIEQRIDEERAELFFCQTDASAPATWPASLNELDRVDREALSCVRFLDPNKAPYQWKLQLIAPAPATSFQGISVQPELSLDGETPGFVLAADDKRQSCYASGLRDDSRLQQTWFHPNGRQVAAQIDGTVHSCLVTLKGKKAPPKGKKR